MDQDKKLSGYSINVDMLEFGIWLDAIHGIRIIHDKEHDHEWVSSHLAVLEETLDECLLEQIEAMTGPDSRREYEAGISASKAQGLFSSSWLKVYRGLKECGIE